MAEVISTYIPPSFYEAFYLYLYFGSMIFLVYMYAMLFRDGKSKPSEFIVTFGKLVSSFICRNKNSRLAGSYLDSGLSRETVRSVLDRCESRREQPEIGDARN